MSILITPIEYRDNLINKFDMIIYTDQDHNNQVLQCCIKSIELNILTLENVYSETEDNSFIESHVMKQIRFYKEVLSELINKLK